jgi:hypothetical protein
MQTDYADYREVAIRGAGAPGVINVKMPFKWTYTWLDGRFTIELTDVRPNVVIAAARFGKPDEPAPPRSR